MRAHFETSTIKLDHADLVSEQYNGLEDVHSANHLLEEISKKIDKCTEPLGVLAQNRQNFWTTAARIGN